jgi:hypothetical protein
MVSNNNLRRTSFRVILQSAGLTLPGRPGVYRWSPANFKKKTGELSEFFQVGRIALIWELE